MAGLFIIAAKDYDEAVAIAALLARRLRHHRNPRNPADA
jgi:hypothetical protein